MALDKCIVYVLFLLVTACTSSKIKLSSEFISDLNVTRIYIDQNSKMKNEILINSFYGKDNLKQISYNRWVMNYIAKCGINCTLKGLTLLEVKNDSIRQLLSIYSSYTEFIENERFDVVDSNALDIKFIISDKGQVILNVFKNNLIVKSIQLHFYEDHYFTDQISSKNEIWTKDDNSKILLSGDYPIIDISSEFKYIFIENKWYLFNLQNKELFSM